MGNQLLNSLNFFLNVEMPQKNSLKVKVLSHLLLYVKKFENQFYV
jgi:hypothetical protein